ncbi:MAG: MerR family transcriptional regulator [Acidimicrobiia bacterium]|jgi:DNA-binding transcriptional MerR regulator
MSESPMRGEGSHLSIGEVLSQLQAEFPDVTISKIRFLESQGLINPERTPSGYRKFYPADVARLRWILVEQRDHFLPLKVIKERLEAHDPATGELPPQTPPAEAPVPAPASPSGPSTAAPAPAVPAPPRPMPPSSFPSPPTPTPTTRAAAAAPSTPPATPRPAPVAPAKHDEQDQEEETPEVSETPVVRRRSRDMTLPLVLDGEPPADDDEGPDTFDRVALARAADVTEAILDELEEYGVIKPFHDDGIRAFYDRDALVCVQAAATLAKHGLQPRHLKMYVHFTEREASLFHQVLAPYLRQRNPVSRAKVDEMLAELVTEARALRGALLRRAIEDALGE